MSAQTPTSALQLALLLDQHDLIGAIEWTLATARRTGLGLDAMTLVPGTLPCAGQWLRLSVTADEPALFPLLVKRLENGVDVREVAIVEELASQQETAAARRRESLASAVAAPVH
ncbi:hypothetical protein EM868_04440 [Cupriavidus gilardii]|uniref:hypothetical protein n=1 Tax=Cupriavidus gilardii TaxID=82541 RepID=UPI001EE51395|nr:hypothetical protein [Cupriavidus gilardii]MCG5258886.1 hypothetical protein [Cupriavidus gilardii]MDF9429048.1 hypothetical protein [Cupriavidus gilardii]